MLFLLVVRENLNNNNIIYVAYKVWGLGSTVCKMRNVVYITIF